MPADTPVTTPVVLTVATALFKDDQTPPVVALDRVTESKRHIDAVPVIADIEGSGLTVTTANTCVLHPNEEVTLYVIFVVPEVMPVTKPDVPIVATDILPLLQTPEGVVLDNIVVPPSHKVAVPVIAPTTGNGFTVTVVV